ncbi:MAG: pyrroline-5-carboxylate reductase [Pirellulales bacterium]
MAYRVMLSERIGFIGAGQMATALARGWLAAGLVRADQLAAVDPIAAARDRFAAELSGANVADLAALAKTLGACDVIVLAVKPQQMSAALAAGGFIDDKKLVVSIAAGVPLSALESSLAHGRLARVMPNTPALVGQGASAFSLGRGATDADGELLDQLLGAVGKAVRVDEKHLDAVTGLSGSGPAFVYQMIEALSDGGTLCGLPRDVATALAAQTVKGAAEMVLSTGEHPAALKDRVASPGGTTIAGLAVLEDAGFRGILVRAVEAASRRAAELGGK